MGDLPSMPLFVDDYEAATAHLTIEEDGAYMRLLRLCWRMPKGTIPDDPKWIQRHLRVTEEQFERVVAPILDEFFVRAPGNGHWTQKRLLRELAYVQRIRKVRADAGRKGAEATHARAPAKPLQDNKTDAGKTDDLLEHPTPLTPTPKPKKKDLEIISAALAIWNEYAEAYGLSKAQRLTDTRRARIRARVESVGGLEGWRIALALIGESDFLLGRTGHSFRASLDFVLQESSFTKLVEGTYRTNKKAASPAMTKLREMMGKDHVVN